MSELIELADEIERRALRGAIKSSDDLADRLVDSLRAAQTNIEKLETELYELRRQSKVRR